MAFDRNKYIPPAPKKLPVILLLDVSTSMMGEKIQKLHDAVEEMVKAFVAQTRKELFIEIAIMTFSDRPELHTPYMAVAELQKQGINPFEADGWTNLGLALQAAKDLIDDKETTRSGNYRPVVVLVSDGEPTDDWEPSLHQFISDGRSARCQRFAVAIGNQADQAKLLKFAEDEDHLFFAETAQDIVDKFRRVTMTVQQSMKSGAAARKEPIPQPSAAGNSGNDWV